MNNSDICKTRLGAISITILLTLVLGISSTNSALALDSSDENSPLTNEGVNSDDNLTSENLPEIGIEQKAADTTTVTPQRVIVDTYYNGWIWISPYWYYYENGYPVKNAWRMDSSDWCYLDGNGRTLRNTWAQLWDSSGLFWYYFNDNGNIVRAQWRADSAGWCYLDREAHAIKSGGPFYLPHPWIENWPINVTFSNHTAYVWPGGGKL